MMMRVSYCFFPVAAVVVSSLLVLPACSQKEDIVGEGNYTIELTAVKGSGDGDLMTRALELEDNFLGAPWVAGETVSVYRQNSNSTSQTDTYEKVGTLTAQSSGYTTTLKGSLSGTFSVGDRLLFSYQHELFIDYRGQIGTLDDIEDNHDFAVARLMVSDIDSGTLIFESGAAGQSGLVFNSLQCIIKFTLKDSSGSPLNVSKLTLRGIDNDPTWNQDYLIQCFDYAQSSPGGTLGPIEVVPETPSNVLYVALSMINTIDSNWGRTRNLIITASVGEETYTSRIDRFWFTNNKYYLIDLTMINPVTDPDVALDADSSYRYGQGTVGSLE